MYDELKNLRYYGYIGGLMYIPRNGGGGNDNGNGRGNGGGKSTQNPNIGDEQLRRPKCTPPRVEETTGYCNELKTTLHRTQKFYEWNQFLNWVDWRDNDKTRRSQFPESILQHIAPTLTPDFDTAMRLARFGWHDYKQYLPTKLRLPLVQFKPVKTMAPRYDIAGGAINIGRYLAGVPDCMHRMTTAYQFTVPAKTIKIIICGTHGMYTKIHKIVQRGYAIYQIINALEMANIRTHVVLWGASLDYDNWGHNSYETYITIKRPEETLFPEKILFALAHPSFLRRLMLSEHERNKWSVRKKYHFYFEDRYPGYYRSPEELRPALIEAESDWFLGDDDLNINTINAKLSQLFAEQYEKMR